MSDLEPSWKAAEKLVAAIEQSLAPGAIVEHNVQLPVLGQNRFRQCDVVLRVGRKPREQLFIIEVQRRGSKPDINTFGGWLRKMDEVGASGLICVSEAGFPDSIIQDVANRVGPKVKLITLDPKNETSAGMPFYLVPEIVRSTYKIRNIDATAIEFFGSPPSELRADSSGLLTFEKANALSHNGEPSRTFSISSLVEEGVLTRDPCKEVPGVVFGHPVDISYTANATDEVPLWFHTDQGIFRLRAITVRASVQRIDRSEPMIYSKWSYIQKFHGSMLAWAATSSFDVDGITVKMTLIFVPDENGFLRPSLELETNPT